MSLGFKKRITRINYISATYLPKFQTNPCVSYFFLSCLYNLNLRYYLMFSNFNDYL